MSKKNGKKSKLPITIEKRLHMYSEEKGHDERHEILWHAWNQNKRWLAQLLQMTMLSFPTYSLHNDTHAKSVLYNIEKILGEDRIKVLSPTDCFMLLHVAYIHDIGMCITADDKEAMFQSDEFMYLLENLREKGDFDMKNAANAMLKKLEAVSGDLDADRDFEQMKKEIHERFDVYQAVIYLMQEAQRGQHGIKSEEHIIDWTMNPDKMGIAFSMSGIPLRIFVWIARCAGMHTDWSFEHVLNLPMKDSGYVHDDIHPRFVAVMLQIGDALDIDNGRFHMFTKMVMGNLPLQSEAHFNKHQSIRQLEVSPEKIMIIADCNSQQALRLVRSECDNIEHLLQHASYFWAKITPPEMGGCLPTMYSPVLMLNGKVIPKEHVTCRFEISQAKAFRILEGENVYLGKFPFMRELIQNAIDATKMQCWRELQASAIKNRNNGIINSSNLSLPDFASKISPENYPVEIELAYGYLDGEQKFHMFSDDKQNADIPEENIGVYIQIKDYGIGISGADIADIADVGTSYQNKRTILRKMPEWLKPTGKFGIGLQSVFIFAEWFKCVTYCRNGECYRIEFYDRSNGGSGYINVEPLDAAEYDLTYGTTFQVFISYKKKFPHDKFMSAWEGKDVFSEDYERTRAKRHSLELIKQIIMDINEQIGEPLFPIYCHINKTGLEDKIAEQGSGKAENTAVDQWIEKIENIVVDVTPTKEKLDVNTLKDYISWLYNRDNGEKYILYTLEDGLCAFDKANMKIYLWIPEISCAVKISAKRIMNRLMCNEQSDKKVKIYYKGIYVGEVCFDNDLGLIEYIDLKGSLKRENLQLSRNGFTDSGKQYIKDKVRDVILPYLKKTFDAIADKPPEIRSNDKWEDVKDTDIQKVGWENYLTLTSYALFYKIYENSEQAILSKPSFWDDLLKNISVEMDGLRSHVEKKRRKVLVPNYASILYFEITEQKLGNNSQKTNSIILNVNKRDKSQRANLAKVLEKVGYWMVICKREFKGDYWRHFLFKFDTADDVPKELDSLLHNIKIESKEREKRRRWHDAIMSLNEELDLKENQGAVTDYSQQILLSWMLRNIPTIASFGTADENMRVNVLGKTAHTCIYRDRTMTYLILDRMVHNYNTHGAMRFATVVWNEFGRLGVRKIPASICCINRGYMHESFYEWVIIPFTGSQLKKILENGENNIQKINQEYERINQYFSIIDYLEKDTESADEKWKERGKWRKKIEEYAVEKPHRYAQQLLFNYIHELEEDEKDDLSKEPDYKPGNSNTLPDQISLYNEFLGYWLDNVNNTDYMRQFALYIYWFKRKIEAWRNGERSEQINDLINKCKASEESQRLYQYVAEENQIPKKVVEELYGQLMDEIINIVDEYHEHQLRTIESAAWYQ